MCTDSFKTSIFLSELMVELLIEDILKLLHLILIYDVH